MYLYFFIIINLFIQLVSSSPLTIFRDEPQYSYISESYLWHESQKFLCVSDKPNDALVWNTQLHWSSTIFKKKNRELLKDSKLSKTDTNFVQQNRFDVDEKGLHSWSQHNGNWSIVSSHDVPMGPVYDSRWEHFTDYESGGEFQSINITKQGVPTPLTFGATGNLTFSIRGPKNAHILICESEKPTSDFCYWIIIGGWENNRTAIRKCANGIPWSPKDAPPSSSPCNYLQVRNENEKMLNSDEWKTFVLTWKEATRTIELFNPDKKVLSYSDSEYVHKDVTNLYYIFYRCPTNELLFRFHEYDYTLTTVRGAILQSGALYTTSSPEICIDMLVGLCNYCTLIISIIDGSGKRLISNTIKRSSQYNRIQHNLPMWQYERIQAKNISNYPTPITLELVASVISEEADIVEDHWAITQFKNCLPEGVVKSLELIAIQDHRASYYWPSVSCQRLSYDDPKSEIIEATKLILTNSNDFEICQNKKIGPNCAIGCSDFFHIACDGVQVCNKIGCSCTQGHTGPKCDTKCSKGSYGFGCSKQCSNCTYEVCDIYTGQCNFGCRTIQPFLIPPYCNEIIERPSEPFIDEIKETSARVFLYEEKNYKSIENTSDLEVEFEIETDNINLKENAHTNIVISNGTEKNIYSAVFNELSPGTKYSVKAVLHVKNKLGITTQIVGNPASFVTLCNWSKRFIITPDERSLLIEKTLEKETYSCPDLWYSIDLSIISSTTNESRPVSMEDTEIRFPILATGLYPFTEYQVCINGNDNEFRDCQRLFTLEAAPPPVTNLHNISITATEAEITWTLEEPLNGVLRGYNVTLEVLYYIGCKNKQKIPQHLKTSKVYSNIPPQTEVVFKLTNLIPYVVYQVLVSAYNSKEGNQSSLIFNTKQRDIPTEVFTNIKLSNNTITWDDPVDCWTITGPINDSRVVVIGVSENVKNFYFSYDTSSRFVNFNLLEENIIHGNEKYRAEIYILRGKDNFVNTTPHIHLLFTTDPSPPPKVQNLEIVEIDESNTTLRWQPPLPPMNGELDFYSIKFLISSGRSLNEVTVYPNETCYLWKNSICKTVPHPHKTIKKSIEVRAYNKGVNDPGKAYTIDDNREEQAPGKPEIISVIELSNGVVYVKWRHPSITGRPLKNFVVLPQKLDTELVNYPSSKEPKSKIVPLYKYEPEYSTVLYLQPSTRYSIFIQGKTDIQAGKLSSKIIETACALDFQYEPHPVVNNGTSLINIVIPPIVNNTKDSKLHIIVQGPSMCKQGGTLSEQMVRDIEVDYHEVAWRVATFSTDKTANLSFTIGDDHIYDGVSNCPLNEGSSYVIVILVREKMHSNTHKATTPLIWKSEPIQIGQLPKIHHESWAVPIVLIILIIGGAIYYYLLKRRNKKYLDENLGDEMTDPIPIYPIIPEKKSSKSNHINETEEDISDIVDIRESILITPSNSTERLNRSIATESIYENLKGNSLIKINEFQDYVKQAIATGKLNQQYELFRRGPTKPWKYGTLPENKSKNRYGNLIAYDETRVILEKLPDDPYSDYINANYIRGYNNDRAYIATQGPKPNTLIDFWRMIWQEEVLVICMLANIIEGGKTKCEQYWPEIGKEVKYGKITVSNISHTVFADYSFRIFNVTSNHRCRKIRQLHFTAWPDHGVPLYTQSVVSYLKKLLATPCGNGPILVHCSAGVGRTGTIIVCDICLRRAAGEGVIDVFGETEMIRNQRANMVDNKQQYLLAHLALVECLLALPTSIPCNDNLPANIQEFKNQLPLQQQRLEESTWQDGALQPLAVSPKLSATNLAKNRFPELAPLASRIYISRYPTTEDDSNYITGVYVDSARHKKNYIASQLPLPNTVGDFWRMVTELKVELIILLQPVDVNDETCAKFVPKPDEEMKPVPFITLKGRSIIDSKTYTQQKVILANSSEKCNSERSITILTCKEWKSGKNKSPPKPAILVDLWQNAERISRSKEPTLVLCYDGVTACGLYLALSFLLERMGLERECDVCLAIRAIRRSRPDFCKSIEQFAYLYDAAAVYSDYFETYANFT